MASNSSTENSVQNRLSNNLNAANFMPEADEHLETEIEAIDQDPLQQITTNRGSGMTIDNTLDSFAYVKKYEDVKKREAEVLGYI